MKSPEYVYGVVKAFRTLLDENRNATDEELAILAKIFSRGGFTQGYYDRKINSSMLGIRSEEEKHVSKTTLFSSEKIDEIKPIKYPISAYAKINHNEPMELTLSLGKTTVKAYGDTPERAINAPLSLEGAKKNLSKFGASTFELIALDVDIDENVIVPISSLNALRRDATSLLEEALGKAKKERVGFEKYLPKSSKSEKKVLKTARFYKAEQITDQARDFFDIIYLPLQNYNGECNGIILSPVILDSEAQKIESMLASAKENGAKYAMVGNLGALELAKKFGFKIHGDFRFNVYNSESVAKLEALGIENIILSPELTLPQIRDIKGDTSTIIYGRIPLMLLEKCVASEVTSCDHCAKGIANITDRRGISFPILREFEHRNVIYNSAPTYMADKESELSRAGITNRHFVFSTETPNEVDYIISCHKNQSSAKENQKIRRI
jgi:putative protease